MTNYYELLKIQPTTQPAEINSAIETQYNQWRRLVTHHDPNVVAQANQALQTLETMRTTLLDPAKRAVYDTAIGLGPQMGGLGDPEAFLSAAAPLAPPRIVSPTPHPPSNLWSCPKCHTNNPPMSEHCFQCGAQMLRQCPECGGKTSLISSGVCGKCGYPYERALQRHDLKDRVKTLTQERDRLNTQFLRQRQPTTTPLGCVAQIVVMIILYAFIAMISSAFSSGSTTTALSYLLVGIGVLVAIFMWGRNRRNAQEYKIRELTGYIEQKEREIAHVNQEYEQLTLQKS